MKYSEKNIVCFNLLIYSFFIHFVEFNFKLTTLHGGYRDTTWYRDTSAGIVSYDILWYRDNPSVCVYVYVGGLILEMSKRERPGWSKAKRLSLRGLNDHVLSSRTKATICWAWICICPLHLRDGSDLTCESTTPVMSNTQTLPGDYEREENKAGQTQGRWPLCINLWSLTYETVVLFYLFEQFIAPLDKIYLHSFPMFLC